MTNLMDKDHVKNHKWFKNLKADSAAKEKRIRKHAQSIDLGDSTGKPNLSDMFSSANRLGLLNNSKKLPDLIKTAILTAREVIDQFDFPISPAITYLGVKNVKTAGTTDDVLSGTIVLMCKFATVGGLKQSFDVPVQVVSGKVLPPSVIKFNGRDIVLAQSSVNAMVQRASSYELIPVRKQFSAPLTRDERESATELRNEIGYQAREGIGPVSTIRRTYKKAQGAVPDENVVTTVVDGETVYQGDSLDEGVQAGTQYLKAEGGKDREIYTYQGTQVYAYYNPADAQKGQPNVLEMMFSDIIPNSNTTPEGQGRENRDYIQNIYREQPMQHYTTFAKKKAQENKGVNILANLGDKDYITYGGLLIVDSGYGPEGWQIETDDENGGGWEWEKSATWQIYRFPLDKVEPGQEEWFTDKLGDVARSTGDTEEELVEMLASDDVVARGSAYIDLLGYFGPNEFDQYPETYNVKQIHALFGEEYEEPEAEDDSDDDGSDIEAESDLTDKITPNEPMADMDDAKKFQNEPLRAKKAKNTLGFEFTSEEDAQEFFDSLEGTEFEGINVHFMNVGDTINAYVDQKVLSNPEELQKLYHRFYDELGRRDTSGKDEDSDLDLNHFAKKSVKTNYGPDDGDYNFSPEGRDLFNAVEIEDVELVKQLLESSGVGIPEREMYYAWQAADEGGLDEIKKVLTEFGQKLYHGKEARVASMGTAVPGGYAKVKELMDKAQEEGKDTFPRSWIHVLRNYILEVVSTASQDSWATHLVNDGYVLNPYGSNNRGREKTAQVEDEWQEVMDEAVDDAHIYDGTKTPMEAGDSVKFQGHDGSIRGTVVEVNKAENSAIVKARGYEYRVALEDIQPLNSTFKKMWSASCLRILPPGKKYAQIFNNMEKDPSIDNPWAATWEARDKDIHSGPKETKNKDVKPIVKGYGKKSVKRPFDKKAGPPDYDPNWKKELFGEDATPDEPKRQDTSKWGPERVDQLYNDLAEYAPDVYQQMVSRAFAFPPLFVLEDETNEWWGEKQNTDVLDSLEDEIEQIKSQGIK